VDTARVSASGHRDRKAQGSIMTDNLLNWLFWAGAAVVTFGIVSATIKYVHSWRVGHKIMAAQAALQTVLCMAGLLMLLIIYQSYLPG
jgi:hypothetical protein